MEILVVEDDADLLPLLTFAFENRGFEVVTFDNGEDALSYLDAGNRPSCLILDLMMPGIDGMDILEARQNSSFVDIPAIMLTAWDNERTVEEAFNRGADDYVTKPFSPNELVVRVRRLIEE